MSPARILASVCGAGCVLVWLGGCQSFSDPPVSFVAGLRVLGIKAEPPQIAPGASTTVTALVVDTDGANARRVLEPVQPAAVAGADGQHRLRRRVGGG